MASVAVPATRSSFSPTTRSCAVRSRRSVAELGNSDMAAHRPLKIGITCYPSVGGSGILASALGVELAERGHEVHFISYGRPFRLPAKAPRLFFHPVVINDYGLFKYPDYTLPLSRDLGLVITALHSVTSFETDTWYTDYRASATGTNATPANPYLWRHRNVEVSRDYERDSLSLKLDWRPHRHADARV